MSDRAFILTLTCVDQSGIVAAVTTELASIGANIVESNQYWDHQTGQFFMRIAFTADANKNVGEITRAIKPAVDRFGIKTTLSDRSRKPKIIIMVSKFDHALLHLLYQVKVGWLNAEVVAIVSNHEDSRPTAELEGVPYHFWKATKDNKPELDEKLLNLVRETDADLVVLARYMQVLSDNVSKRLYGKIINIHHSFLPSFKGAKPYHQAYERGVKLIGATAHYVTADLDEGPIIDQDVERISHRDTPDDLVRKGRDIERRVLARAIRYHLEDRVIAHRRRTVVFVD